MSVVNGKLRDGMPGHGVQPDGRHAQDFLDLDTSGSSAFTAARTSSASPTIRNITSAEACGGTTFGATPPSMSPIAVGRVAEDRIGWAAASARSWTSASISFSIADSKCSGAAEWPARPRARSLTRRIPRVSRRQHAVGRLAVDEEPRSRRHCVRERRAVAPALFSNDEQQPDAPITVRAEPLGGSHLRGEDALRVARATSVQPAVADRCSG